MIKVVERNHRKNELVPLKGKRGITLIALIVTIIVLLILAGVSIATLTGENGILTRANDVKTNTEIAEEIEKIRLAISEAQIGENGYQELNLKNLQDIIENQFGEISKIIANSDGSFLVKIKDRTYNISSNGTVFLREPNNLASLITPQNYGDSVEYSANGIDDWKIFYNDGNNIFLITSDYLDNTKIPNIGISIEGINKVFWTEEDLIYKGSEDINRNIAKKYMLSCLDTCTSNNINMRIVAGLLDTNKWGDFVDKNVAETAIGTATLEMFCASWNQKGYVKLYCDNFDNKGYYIGGNSKPTSFKYEILNNVGYNDTLYYPYKATTEDGCFGYILASPSASDNAHVMRISSSGNVNYRWWSSPADGLRPIVCLKSTVNGHFDNNKNKWILEIQSY